ncbi:MAG: hypothetical protein WCG05_04215 [Alphaproteobacteria bacterium]
MTKQHIDHKSEKVKVQLSLPRDILDRIDEDASKSYVTRSSWVIKASLLLLEKREKEKIEMIVKGK